MFNCYRSVMVCTIKLNTWIFLYLWQLLNYLLTVFNMPTSRIWKNGHLWLVTVTSKKFPSVFGLFTLGYCLSTNARWFNTLIFPICIEFYSYHMMLREDTWSTISRMYLISVPKWCCQSPQSLLLHIFSEEWMKLCLQKQLFPLMFFVHLTS